MRKFDSRILELSTPICSDSHPDSLPKAPSQIVAAQKVALHRPRRRRKLHIVNERPAQTHAQTPTDAAHESRTLQQLRGSRTRHARANDGTHRVTKYCPGPGACCRMCRSAAVHKTTTKPGSETTRNHEANNKPSTAQQRMTERVKGRTALAEAGRRRHEHAATRTTPTHTKAQVQGTNEQTAKQRRSPWKRGKLSPVSRGLAA